MGGVRPAAVAGSFYPATARALRREVQTYLAGARERLALRADWPKAIIVPHAGYLYSGSIAARAYVTLEPAKGTIERVVILGPSHHVAFEGLAVPTVAAFETPLGSVPIDDEARELLVDRGLVRLQDAPHQREHALEVQIPFLQATLGAFSILPIAIGLTDAEHAHEALAALWGGAETVVVVSSDLSHYHDYETARQKDEATATAIESIDPSRIGFEDACGATGVRALLRAAKQYGLVPTRLDLRSSGDTAGGRDEVVGYGAWAFSD